MSSILAYQDMAYIWSDPADSRTCGLVFRRSLDEDYWYEFHGYKLERGPSRLIGALKYMFLNLPIENLSDMKDEKLGGENKEKENEELDLKGSSNPPRLLRSPRVSTDPSESKVNLDEDFLYEFQTDTSHFSHKSTAG
ncbi:hypothetical protein FGIG_12503 [Fasciola gigantica]|uniref:Uncharacterized protein n=1 Tax=Fasciola gigantica TaxID=46835 RepID=A0A504YIQ1_FASGI|nr:hypothetical protein FGIG_12503 [Fasciola gigantica]